MRWNSNADSPTNSHVIRVGERRYRSAANAPATTYTSTKGRCGSSEAMFIVLSCGMRGLVRVMPNGRAERRARRRMSLALYLSRVRSSDLSGGTGFPHDLYISVNKAYANAFRGAKHRCLATRSQVFHHRGLGQFQAIFPRRAYD